MLNAVENLWKAKHVGLIRKEEAKQRLRRALSWFKFLSFRANKTRFCVNLQSTTKALSDSEDSSCGDSNGNSRKVVDETAATQWRGSIAVLQEASTLMRVKVGLATKLDLKM